MQAGSPRSRFARAEAHRKSDQPDPSAALSQLGKTWPITGRVVGLIIEADNSQAHVAAMVEAMQAADVVPMVKDATPSHRSSGHVFEHYDI